MTAAELNAIVNFVGSFGLGAVVAAVVVTLLLRNYFSGYLAEKGKNVATKEDIESITREVERVRHEYSAVLEELRKMLQK